MMLARWQSSFVDAQGNVLPNAQVTIRRESDQAIVGIFSDSDGNTPKSNPFNADGAGFGFFYVEPGFYRITATLGGDTVDWRDVEIGGLVVAQEIESDYYNTSNILGTVTQSGGVPTGAIIERGSNANGEYVKFADGTMICTHAGDGNYGTSPTGAHWTFPVSFVSAPFYANRRTISGQSDVVFWGGEGLSSTTLNGFVFNDSGITRSVGLRSAAIGRWL